MADLVYKDDRRVMVRLRIERALFDALETAYGSQGRALRALREELPQCLMWLVNRALTDADEPEATRAAASARARYPERLS